jgi:glutamate 5-kinase
MANGSVDGILDQIFAGEPVGTLFLPHGQDVPSWKRWLGYTARPTGKLTLDAGARRAVVEQGKSLLAVGVCASEGDFRKGDVVAVCDESGIEFARGLINYSAADTEQIRGLTTEQIAARIGTVPYQELIHRDNLVVIGG